MQEDQNLEAHIEDKHKDKSGSRVNLEECRQTNMEESSEQDDRVLITLVMRWLLVCYLLTLLMQEGMLTVKEFRGSMDSCCYF